MKKILPQANNLETVIKVFIYFGNKAGCTIQDIANFCEFDPRQAQYYLSACIYLDLITEDLHLTVYGKSLFNKPSLIRKEIYKRIITDEVIGKIFAQMIVFGKDDKNLSYNMLKDFYPEYSDAVINRRLSTLINWCDEIIGFIQKK